MSRATLTTARILLIFVAVACLVALLIAGSRQTGELARVEDGPHSSLQARGGLKKDSLPVHEIALGAASGSEISEQLIPPKARIISVTSETVKGLSETVTRLETPLRPWELQIFYTDALAKEWIILRDTLTEGVGWSGVFLQIEGDERRLGIFANVEELGSGRGKEVMTQISILEFAEV